MIRTKGLAPQKNNASVETGDAIDELRRLDSITPNAALQAAPAQILDTVDAQARIAEAENFFNLLWRNVPAGYFGYLWTTPKKKTVPFDVSNAEERHKMAVKAIELNDAGESVFYGVNLLPFAPKINERASKETVALQVATVADIDVEGGTHISADGKKYPPTFDVAKSFLPFDVTILVDSGYGLHGLCIYSEPIKITDDNRAESAQRNKRFIGAIKARAGNFSGIDSVGDLSRVLRVPGTFNLKRGRDNAPMCRVVEVNDVRFTPEDMDTRLADLIPQETSTPEPPATDTHSLPAERPAPSTQYHDADPDYDLFRARIMIDAINPAALDYTDWLAVVSSCKNLGFSYADVDTFNQRDSARYDAGANQTTWDSLNDPSFDIETLHGVAKKFGYSERDTRRKWYDLHPDKRPSNGRDFAPNDRKPQSPAPDYNLLFEGMKPIRLSAGAILNVVDADTKKLLREFFSGNFAEGVKKLTVEATVNRADLVFDSTANTTPALATERINTSIRWLTRMLYPYFADNVPAFKPFLMNVLRRANVPMTSLEVLELDAAIEKTKSTFSGKPYDFAAKFKSKLIDFARHSPAVFQSMLKFDFPRVEKFLADEFTDLSIAETLIDVQGDDLRFAVDQATWYFWRKNLWHAVEVKSLAPLYDLWTPLARKARIFAEIERFRAYCELEDFIVRFPTSTKKGDDHFDEFKRLNAAAATANKTYAATAALEISRNMGAFFEQASGLPEPQIKTADLDSDMNLLNCRNCTYNLNTNSNYSARREDLITLETGTDYDPDATCEAWEKFIGEAIPDDELRDWVQRFFGYVLWGYTDEDIFVFVHGVGGSGKTTFLNAIKTAMGDYAATFPVDLITANSKPKDGNEPSPALASLRGRRLACSSETERGRRLDEAKIKLLTGGSEITARHLHKPIFAYKPSFKIVVDGNYLLNVGDVNDNGLRRRLRIVPFNNPPSPDKVDTALEQKLTTPEARSAVLNWLLDGWRHYQQRGLKDIPARMLNAQQNFYEANDIISDFLEAHNYSIGVTYEIAVVDVWKAYNDWRRRTPKAPIFNRTEFIDAVLHFFKDDDVTKTTYEKKQWFVGFTLDATKVYPSPFA